MYLDGRATCVTFIKTQSLCPHCLELVFVTKIMIDQGMPRP